MKTLQQIKTDYKSKTLDGRELLRLSQFIPENELYNFFGIVLKPDYVGKHKHIPFTRENVLAQLKEDVEFGFDKALNKRGISASLMFQTVMFWNWVLEEGLENFDKSNYAQYGLPLFKATAIKYGFPNEIGDDDGDEDIYSSDYDED